MTDYTLKNFGDSFKQASLGVSVDEQNQLENFASVLRSGARMVEINLASLYGHTGKMGSAERIGRTERQAISNLADSTNVDLSVHAPWSINFAGINPKSGSMDGQFQHQMEREVKEALTFADDVSTGMKKENMPIIFHASYDNFGNPDKSKMMWAYDEEEKKVMPLQGEEMNVSAKQFEDLYGKEVVDKLNKIPNGFQKLSENRIRLSPEAQLEFFKVQQSSEVSRQRTSYEIQKSNLEAQRFEIVKELMRANLQGDAKEAEKLTKQTEELNKFIKDLDTADKRLEIESTMIDKRYVSFDKKAPSLAAAGIKDAAMYSAFETKTKPMILVENTMTPDMSLSNPKETAEAVKMARQLFVEAASKKGMSKSDAEDLSRKVIGINLDVGHVNIFKSYTNPETGKPYNDQDILNMAMGAKDYLKRYHLHDNMGDSDAHLPLGEGNAPVKEVYEALKKAGVEAPAIMEVFGGAGGITGGMAESLQYMGEPIYNDVPYVSMPAYAAHPYSSLMGDYSTYSNLGLKNDIFSAGYGGFSGLSPVLGGGYMNHEGGGSFSSTPMV